MRIDLVITELFVGGAERCLTELALGLQHRGDTVRVFSLGSLPTGHQSRLLERLRSAGISVQSGRGSGIASLAGCYYRLRHWLREGRSDICQTFLFHANVIGTRAARAEGVPLCVGGVRVAEDRRLRVWLERSAVARMDRVVCVSESVRIFARHRLGVKDAQLTVIPNGVDAERFERVPAADWSSFGWPDDSVVSLFVGRLHPQKGIELLQQQVDRLAPPGSQRKLALVGDGPLRGELRAWCDTIGRDRVQLLGWRPDVAPLIKAARVLLLPSRYEGMPNVVLEAMAAGRPVVCSRVEGSHELLGHDLDRQTFPAGDSQSMIERAEGFLNDASVADAAGNANLLRVHSHFSLDQMISAYQQCYRELLRRLERRDEVGR